MSNVKGLPGYVECTDYPQRPFVGSMHGYVRLLANSQRLKTATFFLSDRKLEMKNNGLPEWLKDGAHIEIEFLPDGGQTITLITEAPIKN